MLINAGYEITYECEQPTPMLLVLNIHPSRLPDLRTPQRLQFTPEIRGEDYTDGFGNTCTRIVAPPGRTTICTQFTIHDSGIPDPVAPDAIQHPVESLPTETLVFLLGSRYCDTDHMTELAWSLFSNTPPGWARVQAEQLPHAASPVGERRSHTSACATPNAQSSLPTPSGPSNRYA